MPNVNKPTVLELCAGAGGQAVGLELAGFRHVGLAEIDQDCCRTLELNRPAWRHGLHHGDIRTLDATRFKGHVDLVAAGLPCPPFSVAGKQLGALDERNLFPAALDIVSEVRPRAVMIENVRGFLDAVFEDFRGDFRRRLEGLGYRVDWRLLNASDFGVPQLRPRVVAVALREDLFERFVWPNPSRRRPKTVGEVLFPMMALNEWQGAAKWREGANEIAPTIVGGSKKHGGPDLGPTRARRAWAALGVNAVSLANEPPPRDYVGSPRLTVEMVALLQGFPPSWKFHGKKTAAYRQVGNAFPPPVAAAVARAVKRVLLADSATLPLLKAGGAA